MKAMVSLIEWSKASRVKGPSVIRTVEERKKMIRHFYGTHVFNEMLLAEKDGKTKTLFSALSNQSQKGITVPANPFIRQPIRNILRALVLHWNP